MAKKPYEQMEPYEKQVVLLEYINWKLGFFMFLAILWIFFSFLGALF